MRTVLTALVLVVALLVGCAPATPVGDAGHDVAYPRVTCTSEGTWGCTAAQGEACCGGVMVHFIDQICNVQIDPACRAEASPPDAAIDDGALGDAATTPDAGVCGPGFRQVPGCPCAGNALGCTRCGHVVTCESGTWTVDRGRTCGGCL